MSHRATIEQALAQFAEPAQRDQYFALYAENVVLHGYAGIPPGLDGLKALYHSMWTAFPDLHVHIQDYVEENHKVALRFELTGTHQGPFQSVPATGSSIRVPGITILHFDAGQCVERWSQLDTLLLLTQIGALPPPA
jgi:steroid delta-isomerase-like uncharacterized protein